MLTFLYKLWTNALGDKSRVWFVTKTISSREVITSIVYKLDSKEMYINFGLAIRAFESFPRASTDELQLLVMSLFLAKRIAAEEDIATRRERIGI